MVLTSHAHLRVSQRGIVEDDLSIVLRHGTRVYNGGALFFFMGRKDIPDYLPPARQERLEGITVVMDPETESVITTYRNRKGLRDIKRKVKRYDARRAA